jgi:hypothetical protein
MDFGWLRLRTLCIGAAPNVKRILTLTATFRSRRGRRRLAAISRARGCRARGGRARGGRAGGDPESAGPIGIVVGEREDAANHEVGRVSERDPPSGDRLTR